MFLAIFFSICAGVCAVFVRTLSARLAIATNVLYSTFICYLLGLVLSVIMTVASGEAPGIWQNDILPLWVYGGGALSVVVMALASIGLKNIPSLYYTMLIFVSQSIGGIIIDTLIDGVISWGILIGAMLVGVGFMFNLWVDHEQSEKEKAAEKSGA